MAAPVNLNRYRKAKVRAEAAVKSKQNVVKYGRTKAQKELEKAQNDKHTHDLDRHKTET